MSSRIITEVHIIKIINDCLKNWYEPWKKTFLADGREFKVVYDLMEGLLHYELQLKCSPSSLSDERRNAIAQAVARLVDYGNAILNMDLIVRANDETSSEIDLSSITTIELFRAHVEANKLREKLLYDYFKKDKPPSSGDEPASPTTTSLQVPTTHILNHSSNQEISTRSFKGSNTSINIVQDGRKTPQQISPSVSQLELKPNSTDTGERTELTHILATIGSSEFSSNQNPVTRLAFLPGILSKIETFLSSPTNLEKLTNCFEITDALLTTIEKLPVECRSQEVMMICTSLLKPIVRKVYIEDRDSLIEHQHAHWTAYLICLMKLMQPTEFNTYLRHSSNMADLSAFLKDYLFIVRRSISTSDESVTQLSLDSHSVSNPVFPEYWIEMNLLACSTFLASLTYLYQVLRQLFTANLQMWTSFIECFIYFLLHDALKPSRLMLKQRQRLLARDLRQTSAEYVWITWDSLSNDQKQSLLEELIESLTRACTISNSKERSILLPIFYDMMRCDYTSQYMTSRGSVSNSASSLSSSHAGTVNQFMGKDPSQRPSLNSTYAPHAIESLPYLSYRDTTSDDGTVLTRFTHLIIGKLNTLMIDLSLGDELFKEELCDALSGKLNPKYYNRNLVPNSSDSGRFKSMAMHTSDLVAEFMEICLELRQANQLCYKHLYLLSLFKLILFFKDKVDRVELYLTYLYKLCYLHHGAARYVEAGYTLLEHAKSLPWSDKPLDNHYRIISRYFQTPHALNDFSGLKIFLYNTIMEYFDQGQLWEAAIPLGRELIDVYEFKTFEYGKLAQTLARMSTYFYNIVENSGVRSNPEYFRVTFYGRGFPKTLSNSTMVYRGKPFEKLGDFQATILTKYPNARLLTSLAKPDELLLNDPDARYLQITACMPVVDLQAKFGTSLASIEEVILNFHRNNECDKFQFSRRISSPMDSLSTNNHHQISDDNFANIWRERTTLTTNTLPGILPFFPVYLVETSIVSPIESAIEDMERTNDRLFSTVNRFKCDKRQVEDIRLLGQLLLGIVDAAVNGGITKYEKAFFGTTNTTNRLSPSSTSTSIQPSTNETSTSIMMKTVELHAEDENKISYTKQHNNHVVDHQTYIAQVDKLKCLIAKQVPILDEAIQLHRLRVADIMRPQHEHLEASYKKLKHHIMNKYSRYLPTDYSRSSTSRSYRSFARSPNRSLRSEHRPSISGELGSVTVGFGSRFTGKRMSDVGATTQNSRPSFDASNDSDSGSNTSKIPYKQLDNERRSLPFLAPDHQVIVKDLMNSNKCPQHQQLPDSEPIQIQQNTSPSSSDTTSVSINSPQVPRPIPAIRTNLLSRGAVGRLSQRLSNCDIYTGGISDPPTSAISMKSDYTRLLHDEEDASDNDQNDEATTSITSATEWLTKEAAKQESTTPGVGELVSI